MKYRTLLLSCLLSLPLAAEAGVPKVRNDNLPAYAPNDYAVQHGYNYFADEQPTGKRRVSGHARLAKNYEMPVLNFPASYETNGKKTFIFDPKQGGYAAYSDDGKLVKTGAASGGASWCQDIGSSCRTKVGSFQVYQKKGADCKSSKFPIRSNGRSGGAPMPYCMFFNGGYAVHGSYDVPNYNASHGCVRVRPEDAKWLSNEFMSVGTRVIVRPYGT